MKVESKYHCPVCNKHTHDLNEEFHILQIMMFKANRPGSIKNNGDSEFDYTIDLVNKEPCERCMPELDDDEMFIVEAEEGGSGRQTGILLKVDRQILRELCYQELVDHGANATEEERLEWVDRITHPKWHYMFTSVENSKYFHEKLGIEYPVPAEI